ncbi:MAG: dipeptide epimerase [Balneolaceae bacterium]|nr:dipeptide epimerase [Balneolaceae bacterium]
MSRFDLQFREINLTLSQPFTISRGTKDSVSNVMIMLRSEGLTGLGEAAPNRRYDEDAEKVSRFLSTLPNSLFDDVDSPLVLREKLFAASEDYRADGHKVPLSALAGVEMAWLDFWAKRRGEPLWKLLGLSSRKGPQTSFTIGIDTLEVMQEKVLAAEEYPILKVKLGTDNDREIVKCIREVTQKPIRVDANEGWESVEEAKEMIGYLNEEGIELVEQPMAADRTEDLKKLKAWAPLPLAADESFMGEEPLHEIAECFDIINIKLMKMGSVVKAMSVIEEAQSYGLKVMIGCMIETSIANTAGAVLSLAADYADLDGHLLISDDPAVGLTLDRNKHIMLNERPGLGVELNKGFGF